MTSWRKKIIFSLIALFIIVGEIFNFQNSHFVEREKPVLSDVSTGETNIPTTEPTESEGRTLGVSTTTTSNPTLPTKPASTNPSPVASNTALNGDSNVKNENSEKDDTGNDASEEAEPPGDESDNVLGQSTTPSLTPTPTPTSAEAATSTPTPSPTTDDIINLSINAASVGQVTVTPGTNPCDVLSLALAQEKISSVDIRYSSQFDTQVVYQINGTPNDTSQVWWTYKLNGVLPPKGCSYFTVNNNDNIDWTYVGPEGR